MDFLGLARAVQKRLTPTCLEVQVHLVRVLVEGPAQLQLDLEGLASPQDQLVPVEGVRVVLGAVLTRLSAQQVHRPHTQLHLWWSQGRGGGGEWEREGEGGFLLQSITTWRSFE